MHELSLCQSMVTSIMEQLPGHRAQRVTRIWLEVGVLSCVEPQALAFCFPSVARGTPLMGAVLEICEQPAQAWCFDCSQLVAIDRRGQPCPDCGGYQLRIKQGDALRIKEIEVE